MSLSRKDGLSGCSVVGEFYCRTRGTGEEPSPLVEDFSKFAVWRIIDDRAVPFTI
jgi:hypothetical protein